MQMYTRPNYYYVDRKPQRLIQRTNRTKFNEIHHTKTFDTHAHIQHSHKTLSEIIPRCCISKYCDNVMRYTICLNPRKSHRYVYRTILYV